MTSTTIIVVVVVAVVAVVGFLAVRGSRHRDDGVDSFRRQIDALSAEARRPVVDQVQSAAHVEPDADDRARPGADGAGGGSDGSDADNEPGDADQSEGDDERGT